MNKHKHSIINFYAKIGAPELVFFVSLLCLFFIPFIFNLDSLLVETILLTIFIFALHYLVYSTHKKINKAYNIPIVFLLVIAWIRHFDVPTINFLNTVSEIIIMWISFYFVFKSIFKRDQVDFNTLTAAISGYILIGIAIGLSVFIYQSVNPESFSFKGELTIHEAYYYAFTTMSTLGYGDIVPKTNGAKGLSILITLIGQFYMAIVMGLIIGKLISTKKST